MSLTTREYEGLCSLIESHYPDQSSDVVKFLCRTGRRETHWAVSFRGQWWPVVYRHCDGCIVTVLPLEALRKRRYRASVRQHDLPRPARTGFPLNLILADKLKSLITG